MIRRVEIEEVARHWALRPEIVEKDFAISWIIYGLCSHSRIGTQWIFKGGTCLKKCYIETYRFSEDLDFSIVEGGSRSPAEIVEWLKEVCEFVTSESGLELPIALIECKDYRNKRGGISLRGKIGYRGPMRIPSEPKIKIDLTADEIIVRPPLLQAVYHPYSDRPHRGAKIHCYPLEEILAEKTIAVTDRCSPRDLYDIVRLFRHEGFRLNRDELSEVIRMKCSHHELEYPTYRMVMESPRRAELDSDWDNMLAHQLLALPPLGNQLIELKEYFAWLDGKPLAELPVFQEQIPSDVTWQLPAYMSIPSEWGVVGPIEAIRFAGANRLCIELHYSAKDGRRGVREVEPYSFRRSKDGYLLFYGRNTNRNRVSCYRFDRIVEAKVTQKPFNPRWRVEF
jgi:predicted nucleotidyltransferase component of viral defense system